MFLVRASGRDFVGEERRLCVGGSNNICNQPIGEFMSELGKIHAGEGRTGETDDVTLVFL